MKEGSSSNPDARFELWFQSLFDEGRALAFPCDKEGRVDFDTWGDRLRHNYLFARAMTGREFAMPVLKASVRG